MPWQISVHDHRESWLIDEDDDEPYDGEPARLYSMPEGWRVVETVATLRAAGPIVRELRNHGYDSISMSVEKVASMPEPEPEVEPAFQLTSEPPKKRPRKQAALYR